MSLQPLTKEPKTEESFLNTKGGLEAYRQAGPLFTPKGGGLMPQNWRGAEMFAVVNCEFELLPVVEMRASGGVLVCCGRMRIVVEARMPLFLILRHILGSLWCWLVLVNLFGIWIKIKWLKMRNTDIGFVLGLRIVWAYVFGHRL